MWLSKEIRLAPVTLNAARAEGVFVPLQQEEHSKASRSHKEMLMWKVCVKQEQKQAFSTPISTKF